jgi:hypothetical protein
MEFICKNTKMSSLVDKNVDVLIIKRKIEKYIVSFDVHKATDILSDLNKLKDYCANVGEYNCDSIWIVK